MQQLLGKLFRAVIFECRKWGGKAWTIQRPRYENKIAEAYQNIESVQ